MLVLLLVQRPMLVVVLQRPMLVVGRAGGGARALATMFRGGELAREILVGVGSNAGPS
jgi:hypothetical protein